jgi:hypothetical protein
MQRIRQIYLFIAGMYSIILVRLFRKISYKLCKTAINGYIGTASNKK